MIEDPRYSPQMMVVGFDPSTKRRQEGLVLKDIYITGINGKCINQPIGLINGSIPIRSAQEIIIIQKAHEG